MLAAESYFLQAEAALRGWITGDAKDLYQKGVEASFRYLGLGASFAPTSIIHRVEIKTLPGMLLQVLGKIGLNYPSKMDC